ncbi:hypothetical protein HYV83_04820 [Candidatus Woesearchaeota archaeon]|nr:hypothetical protein [Candidatus Woesearchaeota archaeon]
MESTKEEKARAAKSSKAAACLRLRRSGIAAAFYSLTAFFTVVILAVSFNISSEEATAAQLGVGITIPPVKINQTAPVQNITPSVGGANISIILQMTYNGTGVQNITITLPSGWKKIVNVKINESGVIKNATLAGGQLTWEANHSALNATMIFDAAPPSLTSSVNFTNTTFFQKNLTVESDNSFTNVSVSVEVNSSYTFYTLYWYNGTQFVDKTVEFNLQVAGGLANFSGFSTSTVLFRLEGSISCTESWSCGAWSGSPSCGTRTCTDANHCGTTTSKPSESATCETGAPPAAGGGGGGGGSGGNATLAAAKKPGVVLPSEKKAAAEKTLEVSPAARELLKLFIKPGEFKKTSFSIKNSGGKRLGLNIRSEGLASFLTLATSYAELEPGDSTSIELLLLVDKQTQPGTYSGKIVVSTKETEELIVNVLLDVAPLKTLFDTLVNVNQKTKSIQPGDSVIADLAIFNLLGAGKFDVRVIYGIKDFTDKLITSRQQTIAVETRAGLAAVLELPKDLPPGQYYMFAVVQLEGTTVGVGSDTFNVVSPLKLGKAAPIGANILFILLLSFMVLTALLTFVSVAEIIRHHLPNKSFFGRQAATRPAARKTTEQKQPAAAKPRLPAVKPATAATTAKPASQITLEKKLKVLEQGFSEGLISTKTYIEDKTKIENELKKFKTG